MGSRTWGVAATTGVIALCLVWGGLNLAKTLVNRGGSDFVQHYLAGARLLDGQADRLYARGGEYDAYARGKALPIYGDHAGADTGYVTNAYPPAAALPFVPLAALPFAWAYRLFALLNLAALAGSLVLLVRTRPQEEQPALLAAGGALLFLLYPAWYGLSVGQVNPLLLLACVAAHRLAATRPLTAGFLIAVAGHVKLFPFVLVPWLFAQRRIRAGLAACVAGGAIGLLSLPVLPLELWTEYLRDVLPGMMSAGAHPANHGFTGITSRLLTENPWVTPLANAPGLAGGLAKIGAFGVVAAALVAATRARESAAASDLAFALLLTSVPLAVSKSWEHYTVFFLPAWLLVLDRLRDPRDRREQGLLLATLFSFAVWAFVLRPHPSLDLKAMGLGVQPLLGIKFVASLTLFACALIVTREAAETENVTTIEEGAPGEPQP